MPKKYYGEVLGKFFRNLLFVLLVAVESLCSLLLIFMVGNGIYLFFGKTTLITVTILLVTVPPIWAALYYKARENFRKDAIRVRQERFNEQQGTAFNIEIRYMLPEDIIDQASTICGIDPYDVIAKTDGMQQDALVEALLNNARFDRCFSTSYSTVESESGLLDYKVWNVPTSPSRNYVNIPEELLDELEKSAFYWGKNFSKNQFAEFYPECGQGSWKSIRLDISKKSGITY
ncbi:ATP-dependent protease [Enterococcus phage vB_EFaS_ZC1]